MDTSRASKILDSINLDSPSTKIPYRRVMKPSRSSQSDHKTIKYFQSISRRRIKQSEPLIKGSYLPFDKSELISRIQSFKYNNWTIQSKKLTPLIIARYGWSCTTQINELKCCCCAARLLIKIPQELLENDDYHENDMMLDKLFDKYIEELETGHKNYCPWKKQISPLNVYEINDYKELDIVKRLYEWNIKHLKKVNVISVLSGNEVDVVRKWCVKNGYQYGNIMECSLFGWEVENLGDQIMLKSASCGRRIMVGDDEINLVEEHNEWCCYVEGYKNLINMMGGGTVEEIPDTTSVENTLERLDKLRKLYFEK